jgi:hypothetical protein
MRSKTAKSLKNSVGREDTPKNGQDIREAFRAITNNRVPDAKNSPKGMGKKNE